MTQNNFSSLLTAVIIVSAIISGAIYFSAVPVVAATNIFNYICQDSDNGLNYNVAGTLKETSPFSWLPWGQTKTYGDYCKNDKQTLVEYYCKNNQAAVKEYSCPGGCSAGACQKVVEPLICQWCGTSCEATQAGKSCIAIAPPAGKECKNVNNQCQIISKTTDVPADLNKDFQLKEKQDALIPLNGTGEGIRIKFLQTNIYRCIEGARCLGANTAKINLLYNGKDSGSFNLAVGAEQKFLNDAYTIKLNNLVPGTASLRPCKSDAINACPNIKPFWVATLVVKKVETGQTCMFCGGSCVPYEKDKICPQYVAPRPCDLKDLTCKPILPRDCKYIDNQCQTIFPVELGREFQMQIDQKMFAYIESEKIKIKLVDIKDSRCPKGAQCFWAGEVAATVNIWKDGNSLGNYKLSSATQPAQNFGAYSIKLTKVVRPSENTGSNIANYVLTFVVEKGNTSCVKEGEGLGAVVPGNNKQCCEGLEPYIRPGILGSRGICVKKIELNKEFQLKEKQDALIPLEGSGEGIRVKFLSVDIYRCADGVRCLSANTAKLNLLYNGKDFGSFNLAVGNEQKFADNAYIVKLNNLVKSPASLRPCKSDAINACPDVKGFWMATLIVKKNIEIGIKVECVKEGGFLGDTVRAGGVAPKCCEGLKTVIKGNGPGETCVKEESGLEVEDGLGKTFALKVGEIATFKLDNKLVKVKFIEVTKDNRCPWWLLCYWSGGFVIKLNVNVDGQDLGDVRTVGNYKIRTDDLNQPTGKKQFDYILRIKVIGCKNNLLNYQCWM